MARTSPLVYASNAGEVSPRLDGRVDLDFYRSAARILENMVPLSEGPATRRPGSRFIAEVKDSLERAALVPFEFSTTQAYQIEFGDQYLRFYRNKGQILSGSPLAPYEIASPYLLADLFDSDGRFRVKWAQSADVIYLAHGSYVTRKATRTGHTNWTISEVEFVDGPWLDENTTATTLDLGAAGGSGVSLVASATAGINGGAGFKATDVGRLVRVGHSATAWSTSTAYAAGAIAHVNGRIYQAKVGGTSASTGTGPSGQGDNIVDGTVTWSYVGEGGVWWGYSKIVGFTSTTQVTVDVKRDHISHAATTVWQLGLYSATTGYPTAVLFHDQRLYFGGNASNPHRFDGSKVGDFETFTPGVQDGDPVAFSIDSNQVNAIQWFASVGDLLVGTRGGEFRVRGDSEDAPITPSNVSVKRQTKHGSADMMPVEASGAVLFPQRQGRRLRELAFSIEANGYRAPDMSIRASHILGRTKPIVALAYQQEPWSVVWGVRKDGLLVGFSYQRDERVTAWHRHPVGGDGVVESVSCIPGTGEDELWMIVRRTINGATKRYVEVLESALGDDDAQEDAFYVDCGLSYSGAATATLTGLGHLEGKEVAIWTDKGIHPRRTVASGQISLDFQVTKAAVGLAYTWRLKPMRFEAGAMAGTAQGKIKRIDKVVVRLDRSSGVKVGRQADLLDEIAPRTGDDTIGAAPALISGDREIPFRGEYDTDGALLLQGDDPTPVTIVCLIPRLATHEG